LGDITRRRRGIGLFDEGVDGERGAAVELSAGLQSDALTPDDSRLITPETTPPSIPTTPRRDPRVGAAAHDHGNYLGRTRRGGLWDRHNSAFRDRFGLQFKTHAAKRSS
jgi:hypothetical protein